MTNRREFDKQAVYQIRVKGNLDKKWSDWFDGFTITQQANDETLLTGPVADQSALHGLLARIRDLGLPLLSVKRVEKEAQDMESQTIKPGRWYYGLAALIPVLGCLIAMVMAYQWFPGLPGAWQAKMSLENLTQVVVPGSQDITFAKSGAYAVYYEYRSVVDGVVYTSSETPPALACSLTSKATGNEVGVVPDYVKTNTYSTKDRERVGVLIRSITIDEPGAYTFSCRYADGRSQPEIVLAVGPNFVWEFFGIAARTVVTVAAGLAVLFGSGAVAAVVVIVIALKRRQRR